MASVIDFTRQVCKNEDTLNKQIMENFDQYFAMFALNNIEYMPNLKSYDGNAFIVVKEKEEDKCNEIINKLSSYRCSHFDKTLVPVFTIIDEGLKIEFKVDGE